MRWYMGKTCVRSGFCFYVSKPQHRKQQSRGILLFGTLSDSRYGTSHVASSSRPSRAIHVQAAGGLTGQPNVSALLPVWSAPYLRNVQPVRSDCSPGPLQNQTRATGLDFLERIWPTAS